MDSYHTEPKHMLWMAEWIRREGLSMPWSQPAQPVIPEAATAFEENTRRQSATVEDTGKGKPESFVEPDQTATNYDQEPSFSVIPDIIGPEWFGIQNGQPLMGPPPSSRHTSTAPISAEKGPVDSDDDLTDEDFVNLGSENRYRGGSSDTNSISPSKRLRGNDGHYIHSNGSASMDNSHLIPAQVNRMRQFQPRRARSTYNLPSHGGVQLQDDRAAPIYHGTTDIYGSPPLTRARASRMI